MVANRLLEPVSKLACHEHWVPERVYLPEADTLTLEQLYFALDFLDTHIAAIEREIFFRTADLFRADVDLILPLDWAPSSPESGARTRLLAPPSPRGGRLGPRCPS